MTTLSIAERKKLNGNESRDELPFAELETVELSNDDLRKYLHDLYV